MKQLNSVFLVTAGTKLAEEIKELAAMYNTLIERNVNTTFVKPTDEKEIIDGLRLVPTPFPTNKILASSFFTRLFCSFFYL